MPSWDRMHRQHTTIGFILLGILLIATGWFILTGLAQESIYFNVSVLLLYFGAVTYRENSQRTSSTMRAVAYLLMLAGIVTAFFFIRLIRGVPGGWFLI